MYKLLFLLVLLCAPALAAPQDDVALTCADINAASSGNNTIISATAGQRIVVYKIWFVVNAAVGIKFKDGTGTDFNAYAIPFTAQGDSMTLYFDGKGHWETTTGNAFVINLSGAVQITGRVCYAKR
jgi:hypothetical protein